ncbi:MAG: nicotinamidase [Armatimonadetes bacterium]|nr:nicotinamidase [Armatimonadota bacterium]
MSTTEAPSPRSVTPQAGDALVMVDVQNDFLPGGRLAVPNGDEVVPALNRAIDIFREKGLPVVATRDWHPDRHCSFKEQGGTWPVHCVADTEGARFAPGLKLPPDALTISKATDAAVDAYSGFQDTGLDRHLRERSVKRVFVGGLATDYCVLNTVNDALDLGFQVFLLTDAVRAVDVKPGDGDRAMEEMKRGGAVPVTVEDLAP